MIEVSPCCGQGDFLCTVLGVLPGRWAKNEAGRFNIVQPQIQARPCLIVLGARPGKPPEKRVSFSGTECFGFRTIHGGSGSEKQDSRACFSFGDPQNKISTKLDVRKKLIAAELAYKSIVIYLD
jgi:hypothetical protein